MSSRAVEPAASRLLSVEELHARLREVGEQRYHHQHPFHLLMHEGKLTRGQLQAWVLNRYYYQSRIPIKDAIILSRSDDSGFRRAWRKRVLDHDGDNDPEGGIERWIRLAKALGLSRERVIQLQRSAPRSSLCGRRLHRSGEEQILARSCSVVSDRAFLSRFDYPADGRFSSALSLAIRWLRLLRSTVGSGSDGRPVCISIRGRPCGDLR